MPDLLDYPCPSCGYEGPHAYFAGDRFCAGVAECGACYVEFDPTREWKQ